MTLIIVYELYEIKKMSNDWNDLNLLSLMPLILKNYKKHDYIIMLIRACQATVNFMIIINIILQFCLSPPRINFVSEFYIVLIKTSENCFQIS